MFGVVYFKARALSHARFWICRWHE